MHIRCHCHLIALLSVQLVTLSIAVFVPKTPSVAGQGSTVGNAARAGDNITPGNGARPGSNPARAGSLTGSDLNGGAAQGGPTAGQENTGKVFEEVIDLIIDSVPNTNNNDNKNNPNTATITTGPTIPTSAVTNPTARACLEANDIHNRCTAQTPGFDAIINQSSQASCLCYGTTSGLISWQGQSSYGGPMSSCYNYVTGQAGHSAVASGVRDQASLCGRVRDVRRSAANEAVVSSFYATEPSGGAPPTTTSTRVVGPESTGGGSPLGKNNGGGVLLLLYSMGLLLRQAVS
ncbi:MAG: hypothetical protein L6R36_001237 [Xanthoria steineri]|nr:MAG: hypothetical protein L6R36_001237 [Xanthoria steineri]